MSEAAKKLETPAAPAPNKLELQKLLEKLETLPTLPTIVHELTRLINDPTSSAADVMKVMERDQSLTAKVLTLINSAYYAIPGGVSNLQRAIAYLGYDTIGQLVMSASVFKLMNKTQNGYFNLSEFWKHAVGVAMAAETIAKWSKYPSPPDCFTCGLLHDLGKVALYQVDAPYLDQLVDYASKSNLSIIDAEANIPSVPHTTVGGALAKKWKLPLVVQASIEYHHELDTAKRAPLNSQVNQAVDIVCIANVAIHELDFGNSGHKQKTTLNELQFKKLNLSIVQWPLILKDIQRNLESADNFIKIIAG